MVEKTGVCSTLSRRPRGITVIFTHEQSVFPRTAHLWEIGDGQLRYCGAVPDALRHWEHAPPLIRRLVAAGRTPDNLTPEDLVEAACRT